jgi:hypothetical protein
LASAKQDCILPRVGSQAITASAEGFLQMEDSAQIGLVRFLGAEGRLGIVFQEKITRVEN